MYGNFKYSINNKNLIKIQLKNIQIYKKIKLSLQ